MSKNYDNWEKLVVAVLRREQLRQLALSDSIDITDDDDLFHHQLLAYKGHSPPSITADFDVVNGGYSWERSAPSDHPEIISRSVPGKSVFIPVEARELTISSFPETHFTYLTSLADYDFSRFEVVQVKSVESLDIRARIKTRLLSPKTIYGACLLFMPIDNFEGLVSAKAMVRFVDMETEGDAEWRADIVHLQAVNEKQGKTAVERVDGWMEIQIGNLYIDECDDEQVEARVTKTSCCKMGLIIVGVEFRPLAGVRQV